MIVLLNLPHKKLSKFFSNLGNIKLSNLVDKVVYMIVLISHLTFLEIGYYCKLNHPHKKFSPTQEIWKWAI